ncbi:MAG: TetR/AcrR family transcriptional regulator [Bacillaceae bacterium]
MFSKFLELEEGKKSRILNAAMKEFAHKGYKNASTNEIVKEAGISKGMLFHYFQTKKQLFLFLYSYAIEKSKQEIYKDTNFDETDFFVKIEQTMAIKMEISKHSPDLFTFLEVSYLETDKDVREEIKRINDEKITNARQEMFGNLDYTKFKDNLDCRKAIQIVMWSLDRFTEEELKKEHINYDHIYEEAKTYIAIFKQSFYK